MLGDAKPVEIDWEDVCVVFYTIEGPLALRRKADCIFLYRVIHS